VSAHTVRFYERKGLLPETGRSEAGYRQYGEDAVRRLVFIRRAKALGFTLREIADLLALSTNDSESCSEAEQVAALTIKRIDSQVSELERMKAALEDLARTCRTRTPSGDCPILHSLEAVEN
jgi:DNA-binding transcriptional MerR regulator